MPGIRKRSKKGAKIQKQAIAISVSGRAKKGVATSSDKKRSLATVTPIRSRKKK